MYHLTLIRMSIIKKSTNNKYWRGCREKGTPLHCWKACKLEGSLWRVWRFLKKLKIELSYDPAIPFLAIHLEEISYCVSSKHWYSFQLPAWHLGFLQKPQTQYSKTNINIHPHQASSFACTPTLSIITPFSRLVIQVGNLRGIPKSFHFLIISI